jgi:hypothetical protein
MSEIVDTAVAASATQPSFYAQRMQLLGVNDTNNIIDTYNPRAEHPAPKWGRSKLFTEDKDGNIEITYYNIDAELIIYDTDAKTPQPRVYKVKRLKNPQGDMKYRMPSGQGQFPWFHPSLVKKYKDGEKIEKLYLTEGVFKSFLACESGIDCVGLSSITHYAGSDKMLHRDIRRIIERCQVDIVVILWDGDCLNVSAKGLVVREEATKRPAGFFNTARTIRKLVKEMPFEKSREAPTVYFMHVKSDSFPDKAKGLDDALISAAQQDEKRVVPADEAGKTIAPSIKAAVVQDCLSVAKKGPYFFKMDISNTTDRLKAYFGLENVEVFYKMHAEWIAEKEFLFQGDLYYYNETRGKLEVIAPGWAKNLRWIGDEFFIEQLEPSGNSDRRVLRKYTRETLKDLYGKDFIKYLKHFSGFCNLPSHLNYEQVVEREGHQYYNRYFRFPHVAEKGEIGLIIDFFKHIFSEKEITHPISGVKIPAYEMGLDYIQLMLTNPVQALPVICLYSPENNTGKSTLGKLVQYIYGDNVIQISNSDLESDFNETYSDKLLAICEETLLERKRDVERIKALSTSDKILVNPKGQRQFTIDFFCKFWFFSNNRRMIYVTRHDERFWIIKVQKSKVDNPNLLDQMKAQVPAFVSFLQNRTLATSKESRMWFYPSLIKTETFEEVVTVNEPSDATELREGIEEMFLQLELQGEVVPKIEMTLKEIKDEFFSAKSSTRWLQEVIQDYLQVDLKRNEQGDAVFERGAYKKVQWDDLSGEFSVREVKWRGRPYVFERDKFLSAKVQVRGGAKPAAPALPQPEPNDILFPDFFDKIG